MNPQTCTSPYGRSVGRRRWRRRRAGGGGEERRRRRREALGGGRRRTRGRGRGGAGRRRGGACGRRGCPGTASRSSRSSTCPAASPIPFRRLPFFSLPLLEIPQPLHLSPPIPSSLSISLPGLCRDGGRIGRRAKVLKIISLQTG